MNNIVAEWTGKYPCLCHGKWVLTINGIDASGYIPEELISSPMNTRNKYEQWYFDDNMSEDWFSYKDGLGQEAWIKNNKAWLDRINKDIEIQKEIFNAFKAKDWRYNCCGGCI